MQCLHGSEVGFWLNAETHAAGVLQAVPNEPGSEIILESTANGPAGFFYSKWQEAEDGGEYVPIFTSWPMSPEYRIEPNGDYELTPEEKEYGETYGLDAGQLLWRRLKIAELRDPLLFQQEYPISAAEAFVMSGSNGFIPPGIVVAARKAKGIQGGGPLVVGVDPAGSGGDRIAFAWRRGRAVEKVETKRGLDTMGIVGEVVSIVQRDRPAAVFIDATGLGQGVYDRAREMVGYAVTAVHFASKPFRPQPLDEQLRPTGGPLNRRAECWQEMKDWLEDEGGASIPDRDDLQADLCGPTYSYDSSGRLKLERKEEMKRRGLRSPDLADAIALTFAEPVSGIGRRDPNFHRKIVYPKLPIV